MHQTTPTITDDDVKALLEKFLELRASKNPCVMANPDQTTPTIIIVGAGISGITAALSLTKAGFHVCLIDARDRIGGRIKTQRLKNGAFVELGAQFLHGIKGNPLFLTLGDYDVELKPLTREGRAIFDANGKRIQNDQLEEHLNKFKSEIASLAQKRLSDTKDRFLAEELHDLANQVQYSSNIDPKQIDELIRKLGAHEFTQETMFAYKLGLGKKESEGNYIVTNGFASMLYKMLEEAKQTGLLSLNLNSPVDQIKHDDNEVMVVTKDGQQFKGDGLICSLPLGVLQQGDVAFTPPLQDTKQSAIMRLKMADHDKIIFAFDKVFWPHYSHFVIPFDPNQQSWIDIINLNYFADGTAPVLIASLHNGHSGAKVSEKEMIQKMSDLMQKIFDDYEAPEQTWVTHWGDDPFARGSYCSHPETSTLDDNTEIARPIGRLCFAGEHTHRAPASVQGAYLSGLESSVQVVKQMKRILGV